MAATRILRLLSPSGKRFLGQPWQLVPSINQRHVIDWMQQQWNSSCGFSMTDLKDQLILADNEMIQHKIIEHLEMRIKLLRSALTAYADDTQWTTGTKGFLDLYEGCENGADIAIEAVLRDNDLRKHCPIT